MRVIKGEYWEGALRLVREMFRGSGDDDDDDGGDCDGAHRVTRHTVSV